MPTALRTAALLAVVACLLTPGLSADPAGATDPAAAPPPTSEPEDRAEVREYADIVYGSAVTAAGDRVDLALDLFLPTTPEADRPAVVLAHGGGFRIGSRKDPRIRRLAVALAGHGYVTASVGYRLRPTGTRGSPSNLELFVDGLARQPTTARDAQHDLQAAIRYLRRQATPLGVDPDRIAALGSSAGAMAALEVAFNPEDPGRSGAPGHRSDVGAAVSLWGASHPSRIEPNAPPILMFHGTHDVKVPFLLGLETCTGTRAKGNICEAQWWPADGHALWDRLDEITTVTLDFLERNL